MVVDVCGERDECTRVGGVSMWCCGGKVLGRVVDHRGHVMGGQCSSAAVQLSSTAVVRQYSCEAVQQ